MVTGLAGALLMIASSAWVFPAQALGSACQPSGGCVLVELIRGDGDNAYATVALQVSDVEAPANQDVTRSDGVFTLRPAVPTPSRPHGPGVSVRKAVQLALGTDDLTSVNGADVVRANGTSVDPLDRDDLLPPGSAAYPFISPDHGDDTATPMFFAESDGISYARPLRIDPEDTNAVQDSTYDSFGGVPLIVKVHLEPQRTLQPVVRAEPDTVKLGESMTFSIEYADGQLPTGVPRYYWNFSDAGTGAIEDCTTTAQPEKAGVTHTYKAKGTYVVQVLVCGDTSSGESPGTFTVSVDPPAKPSDPGPGGSGPKDNPTKGPLTGPDRGHGNGEDGTPNETQGAGGNGDSAVKGVRGNRRKEQASSAGEKSAEQDAGTAFVSGVLLDADAAKSVTVRSPEAAPIAAAPARRGTEVPRSWRWLLALLPLTLLLGGVARQTPWLARRLPRIPWRDV